jgi:hypothetical protein
VSVNLAVLIGLTSGRFPLRQPKALRFRRTMRLTLFTVFAVAFYSVACGEDFKTTDGTEYKNVTISRIEPDGVVVITSSGISKIYFRELPHGVQQRFHYDPVKAAEFTSQENQKLELLRQQQALQAQRRAEEREKYWQEHPMPRVQSGSSAGGLSGSALDQRPYGQSITAQYLISQYALNQVNADRLYKGRTFTISGTIKSIAPSKDVDGETAVELLLPYSAAGEVHWMQLMFSDSRGLEQFQAGNPIAVSGTVAGVRYRTLIIRDCQLLR